MHFMMVFIMQAHAVLCEIGIKCFIFFRETSLVVLWSESLHTNQEVPGSIPGSTVGIFLEGEDSRGDHGLRALLALHPPISPRQRNRASWASQHKCLHFQGLVF